MIEQFRIEWNMWSLPKRGFCVGFCVGSALLLLGILGLFFGDHQGASMFESGLAIHRSAFLGFFGNALFKNGFFGAFLLGKFFHGSWFNLHPPTNSPSLETKAAFVPSFLLIGIFTLFAPACIGFLIGCGIQKIKNRAMKKNTNGIV